MDTVTHYAFGLGVALALAAGPSPAAADTFVVNATASDDDGSCDPAPDD